MKITNVELGMLSVPLRVPFKTARRRVDSVEDVIVLIRTDTGATGYGEAPPTGVVTGDTTGGIIDAIRTHLAPMLIGRDVNEFEDLIRNVQTALIHNTSAKAAVDMALYDLYGQLWNIPVHKLLGGARDGIVTDITISVNAPEEMARDARDAIRRGYDTLKIKVGIDPSLDVARLVAVRDAVGNGVRARPSASSPRWQRRGSISSWWSSPSPPPTLTDSPTSRERATSLSSLTRLSSPPPMHCASCSSTPLTWSTSS